MVHIFGPIFSFPLFFASLPLLCFFLAFSSDKIGPIRASFDASRPLELNTISAQHRRPIEHSEAQARSVCFGPNWATCSPDLRLFQAAQAAQAAQTVQFGQLNATQCKQSHSLQQTVFGNSNCSQTGATLERVNLPSGELIKKRRASFLPTRFVQAPFWCKRPTGCLSEGPRGQSSLLCWTICRAAQEIAADKQPARRSFSWNFFPESSFPKWGTTLGQTLRTLIRRPICKFGPSFPPTLNAHFLPFLSSDILRSSNGNYQSKAPVQSFTAKCALI